MRALEPKRLVLSIAVAPLDLLESLGDEADEIVCLCPQEDFVAIGLLYGDFSQVSDGEAITLLDAADESVVSA